MFSDWSRLAMSTLLNETEAGEVEVVGGVAVRAEAIARRRIRTALIFRWLITYIIFQR